jgi:ABC-type antimicrobial peptide transport system permease subunit
VPDKSTNTCGKPGKIFAAFSVLTIIITCLRLLGLTAFTTQQKQKESSIRRVMGARILQVVTLITKNYLWLALISAGIAFPVAWYWGNIEEIKRVNSVDLIKFNDLEIDEEEFDKVVGSLITDLRIEDAE